MSLNLDAIRSMATALRASLDALDALLDDGEPEGCPHERREQTGTFGTGPRWTCRDCGAVLNGGGGDGDDDEE